MPVKGFKTANNNNKPTAAVKKLIPGPAENTEYLTTSLAFSNCFSSGSTNAPAKGPKNTKPVFLILIPWALATIPCPVSWIKTTKNGW